MIYDGCYNLQDDSGASGVRWQSCHRHSSRACTRPIACSTAARVGFAFAVALAELHQHELVMNAEGCSAPSRYELCSGIQRNRTFPLGKRSQFRKGHMHYTRYSMGVSPTRHINEQRNVAYEQALWQVQSVGAIVMVINIEVVGAVRLPQEDDLYIV